MATMKSKISYALTGLFVVILGLTLVVIAFWLSQGLSKIKYNTYIVYMNESVTGLNINAPVKYHGVDVGFVKKIELNVKDPQQVKLLLNIEEGIPIRADNRATLLSQGLTGMSLVNLTGGKPNSPLLTKKGEDYPVIKAEPSLLFRLDTSLRTLTASLTSLSEEMKAVLGTENRESFRNSLNIIESQLPRVLSSMQKTSIDIQDLTSRLNMFVDDLQQDPSMLIRGRGTTASGPGEE